jgi:hypothetical protein
VTGISSDGVSVFFRGTNAAGDSAPFTWSTTPRGTFDRSINAMWGTAPNDTWAVGQSGLVTHWNGTKWVNAAIRVTDVPGAATFRGIWGVSSDDFWIVGDQIALHKTNGGKP